MTAAEEKRCADEILGECDQSHMDDSFRDKIAAIIRRYGEADRKNGKRLQWLIDHGYTPAQWRSWTPADGPASRFPNGMVQLGWGGVIEIDAAMERESNAQA